MHSEFFLWQFKGIAKLFSSISCTDTRSFWAKACPKKNYHSTSMKCYFLVCKSAACLILCGIFLFLSILLWLIWLSCLQISDSLLVLAKIFLSSSVFLFHGESLSITLLKIFKTFSPSNSPAYVNHSTFPVVIRWWLWRRNTLLSLRGNISVPWYSDAYKIPEWPSKRLSKHWSTMWQKAIITIHNTLEPKSYQKIENPFPGTVQRGIGMLSLLMILVT